ncbi:MAG TPA: YceD family protein [Steroidobacteraceae bacterium]|nr:YceD family protein [Steroidobacteraceae bacterium]
MSPPWSKPLDVERLADGETDIDFEVPLAELPRLCSRLIGVAGVVRGRAHFARESGFPVAELTLEGTATLTCQRCLGPVSEPVNSSAHVALIASEADAGRVPEHLEPVLAQGGRISAGELVEEELLLGLPIVPLHARAEECSPEAAAPRESVEHPEQTTQRPFEQLGELLKR